jgi:Xaa-Pro aminopeptidase
LNNTLPLSELSCRWERCRNNLQQFLPQAEGLLLFSRLNIYYFSGCFVSGVLWMPLTGEPVLFCRRGIERAKIESPLTTIVEFKSYGDIEFLLREQGAELPAMLAAEMNGLPWSLANSLTTHLAPRQFVPGDKIIAMTRAGKSEWELEILRQAGARHDRCLTQLLPPFLHEGISELEICHKISDIFFSQGHHGILRMENYGEEVFLGHVSVGDSANYPSVFNGPVGLRGIHPATPYMGSDEVKWRAGRPLIIDNGFSLAGYMTDKTQVYWLGGRETIPAQVRKAHDFCIEMQAGIADSLRPGALPSEIWSQCLALAERSEWAEGFMGLGKNKVSFVGHGIGLAIDEYPVLAQGFDLPLEAGMAIAVEPKIGLPGVGMVGVENTFEVTAAGGKCLTGDKYDMIII